MRIDFFHVDLLPKASIKGVTETYANEGVEFDSNLNKNHDNQKKHHTKNGDYSSDILKDLNKYKDLKSDSTCNNEFISEDKLQDLKKAIEENNYNINTKILLISLIKYIERI